MVRGGRVGWDSHREQCMHMLCNILLLNKKGWDGEPPELTSHILLKFCFLFKYVSIDNTIIYIQ